MFTPLLERIHPLPYSVRFYADTFYEIPIIICHKQFVLRENHISFMIPLSSTTLYSFFLFYLTNICGRTHVTCFYLSRISYGFLPNGNTTLIVPISIVCIEMLYYRSITRNIGILINFTILVLTRYIP